MKRVLFMALAIMVAVAFSVAATGAKVKDGDVKGREVLEYDSIHIVEAGYGTAGIERPTLRDKEMLEKFGIKLNYEELPQSGYVEKLNLLFATNEEPEVVLSLRQWDLERWGNEGYLVPLSDYFDKLPTYMALWDKHTWDYAYASSKTGDGKLYWLPGVGFGQITGYSWIYRKGTFDKMGLTFPKTTDELYTTLKKIKQADPDSVPYPNRWGASWLMAGFTLAYRTADHLYVDIDTGNFVYGPSTDKMRDALVYVNKLYREKLVEQEFPTATTQQWTEKFAQGKTYIQYSYVNRAQWADETMASADPDANWTWAKEIVAADPGKKPIVSRWGYEPFMSSGPAISKEVSAEKIDRLLEYFDWACTEEGQILHSFGVEGVTFEYKAGKPAFMDHMYTINNSEGTSMVKYGFSPPMGSGFMVARRDYFAEFFGSLIDDLDDARRGMDYIKDNIAWDLSTDQEKELADLETVIKDIWNEYSTKFIMGKLDPSNDSHWNEYLSTLKQVGLERVMEIREEALKKSTVF